MIDSMMTLRFASLYKLPVTGRYKFIDGDVIKINLLPHFAGAYAVVHLAAITDAAGSFDKAMELVENIYKATEKVA